MNLSNFEYSNYCEKFLKFYFKKIIQITYFIKTHLRVSIKIITHNSLCKPILKLFSYYD